MNTEILRDITPENIKKAAEVIKNGGLVVFPTETVYGLGASALNAEACVNIFKAKGRPADNPLIVHLATPEEAEKYAYTNDTYYKLAECFMPGPLTVILPKKEIIPYTVTCGLETVALRVPVNRVAHELIVASGCPIAAPSANLSGRPSPTAFEHVYEDMNGRADIILDGGECEIGLESTVIRLIDDGIEILRPGKITVEDIEKVCSKVIVNRVVKEKCQVNETPASPGMKYRHYAPKAPVYMLSGDDSDILKYMSKKQSEEKCGILCFDEDAAFLESKKLLTFGRKNDIDMQAHELFDKLRKFDSMDVDIIYARIPLQAGVGLAVYNRLAKAAGFCVIKV